MATSIQVEHLVHYKLLINLTTFSSVLFIYYLYFKIKYFIYIGGYFNLFHMESVSINFIIYLYNNIFSIYSIIKKNFFLLYLYFF